MAGGNHLTLFGVYVSESVFETLADVLYEEAGVIDLETYFDPTDSSVPPGDPGAKATNALIDDVVTTFAALYDEADFEAARRVDADGFVLVHLAGTPAAVSRARELFRAAGTIQETDLRTVQTAILEAYCDRQDGVASTDNSVRPKT